MQETTRDWGSIPGLGRSPGGGHSNPLQYSCLENPHGQRSLVSYSPWGHKELDTTKRLSTEQTNHHCRIQNHLDAKVHCECPKWIRRHFHRCWRQGGGCGQSLNPSFPRYRMFTETRALVSLAEVASTNRESLLFGGRIAGWLREPTMAQQEPACNTGDLGDPVS